MTIHWKALSEQFLFNSTIFRGKMYFLNFSEKNSVLKELRKGKAPVMKYGSFC
jgi:hypothetical protein